MLTLCCFFFLMYILAHLGETNEHNTVSPNRDFQGYPDSRDVLRNAWNDSRASKNADTSANVHPVKHLSTTKYMTAYHSKPEIMQQELVLHTRSEQSKNTSMESTVGHQKPTLRSITSPLIAHRLKPIRQKTKKAVVCQLFFLSYYLTFSLEYNS